MTDERLPCPGCGCSFRVTPERRGKKARCKHCDTSFVIPPGVAAGFAGATLDHAYVMFKGLTLKMTDVSNPESLQIVP